LSSPLLETTFESFGENQSMLIFIAKLVGAWLLLSAVATPLIARWVVSMADTRTTDRRAAGSRPRSEPPLWGRMVRASIAAD
jgi:hypothetical protein